MRSVCHTFAKIFPLDEFELVQLRDRAVGVADGDSPGLLERRGIEETQLRRAVAHDQPRAVVRQAPALAGVRKRLDLLEGADVVEERDFGLPRELKQRPFQSVMPSPKCRESSGCICRTSPVSSLTLRMPDRPFNPVPSYRTPSR